MVGKRHRYAKNEESYLKIAVWLSPHPPPPSFPQPFKYEYGIRCPNKTSLSNNNIEKYYLEHLLLGKVK